MEYEAGFEAITFDGIKSLNEPLVGQLGLTKEEIDEYSSKVIEKIRRRTGKLRREKPFPDLKDNIVMLVEDGLAFGYIFKIGLLVFHATGAGDKLLHLIFKIEKSYPNVLQV